MLTHKCDRLPNPSFTQSTGSDYVLVSSRKSQPCGNLESNQMDKVTIYGLGIFAMLFAIIFVYAASKYSRIFWCATIGLSDFNEVERNVYIDNKLENSESARLQLLINQAKSRINNKYGLMTSSPVVIVVDNKNTAEKYGLGPGHQTVGAYITPWGEYLVVSSSTQDVNLLAHEYFHIEISKRIGYLVFKTKLPVWLDEGLALQVDYRERYKLDNRPLDSSEIDRVKKLNRSSEFFTDNNEQTIKNILAAKAAVYEILNQHSSKSLYSLFSRVRKGEDIADVFSGKQGRFNNGKPSHL